MFMVHTVILQNIIDTGVAYHNHITWFSLFDHKFLQRSTSFDKIPFSVGLVAEYKLAPQELQENN